MTEPALLDADDLGQLAGALLSLPPKAAWPDPPFLVALPWGDPWRVDDEGFDLEARPLFGDADLDLAMLCHQQAKPEWVAIGIVADGWTIPPAAAKNVDWRTLHRNSGSLRTDPSRRRVRTLHLVGRGGPVAMAIKPTVGDDPPETHTTADGAAAGGPVGPLPDALRRVFGLPTPVCDVSAHELWASIWLSRVAARKLLRWTDVAAAHPAVEVLQRAGAPIDATEHLPMLGDALAMAKGWDALHLASIQGDVTWVSGDVAAWADAGMFARLVLRAVHPVWWTFERLEVPEEVLVKISETLRAWDVCPTPPGQ